MDEGLREKFLQFVVRAEGCWGWTGPSHNAGYGQIYHDNMDFLAHRVAYELFIGQIPDGMHVLHHCDNPPCTNPTHLFLGTHADNMHDMVVKGRSQRGERNGRARLTEDQVLEIRAAYTNGDVLQRELAHQYGIATSLVSRIVNRKIWAYL